MSPARLFPSTLITLALALPLLFATTASADRFPSITGTWTGAYKVAFAHNHPQHGDQALDTHMELEVYKQEGNLFWAINRWRRDGAADWVEEYATGSFDLDDRDEFIITEEGPAAEDWINTGFFLGELDDGKLYLNYIGQGDGVSFAVELRRK